MPPPKFGCPLYQKRVGALIEYTNAVKFGQGSEPLVISGKVSWSFHVELSIHVDIMEAQVPHGKVGMLNLHGGGWSFNQCRAEARRQLAASLLLCSLTTPPLSIL